MPVAGRYGNKASFLFGQKHHVDGSGCDYVVLGLANFTSVA